jgi:hypothetical protein
MKNKPRWVSGRKIWEQVEEPAVKVILSQGDVKILKKAGSRIFAAASRIFTKDKQLTNTLNMLEKFCWAGTLKRELVALSGLKRIGFKTAEALYNAGYTTPQQFAAADNMQLSRLMVTSDSGKKRSIGSPRVLQNIKILNKLV